MRGNRNRVKAAQREPTSFWTPVWRAVVFLLSAASIWCLLAEMYGLCSMQTFTIRILLPATIVLVGLAFWDRARGDGRLWRGFVIGSIAGFAAAIAYDVFRLPFVFSRQWGLNWVVPPIPLFKVFPRFGAMILGQAVEQPEYSLAAHLVGWAYHFSNGVTFGIMYLALIGDGRRRAWWWGIVLAVGLELAMLFTPYPGTFGIRVTGLFVVVTLTAHLIFGVVLGALSKSMAPATRERSLVGAV